MELSIQLAFVVGILAYGVVLSKFIPEKFHLLANFLASILAVASALRVGLDFHQLGLSLKFFWPGLLVALVASIALVVIIFILSRISYTRKYFASSHSALRSSPSRLAYETAVRIPISTALTEEILFRGVLLGVLATSYNNILAIVLSSIVFGLWHISPALNTTNKSYYLELRQGGYINRLFHTFVDVLATACAGVFFAYLRILSGSVLAPWLIHWVINSSALLSSFFVAKGRAGGDV